MLATLEAAKKGVPIKRAATQYGIPTNTPNNSNLALIPNCPVSHFLVSYYLGWTVIQRHPRLINIVYPLGLHFKAILFKDIIRKIKILGLTRSMHTVFSCCIPFTY